MKTIVNETESFELSKFLTERPITSRFSRVEVLRRLSARAPEFLTSARETLDSYHYVELDRNVLDLAESFQSEITLKASDAIHVATAYLLGNRVPGIITYDKQMALNAQRLGIAVASPGRY